MRKRLALAALLLPVLTHPASAGSEVLWTIPVEADSSAQGLWVPDGAMMVDGRLVVLGREGQKVLLMVEDETGVLTEWTALPLEGSLVNITADPANGLWLTGHTRDGTGAEGPFRDAAILRLNRNGVIAWGRVFGEPNEYWSIEDAAVPPTGGIVISGNFGEDQSFVARVDVSGEWLWHKTFGLPKGTRVAVNDNGDVLVAGFESNGGAAGGTGYAEHGTLWVFSEDGDLRSKTTIRPEINSAAESSAGVLALALDARETDIATAWNGVDAGPVIINRFAPDGAALSAIEGLPIGPDCAPSLAGDSGRLWLGCATEGAVNVYEIDRETGAYGVLTAAAPECQGQPNAILEMTPTLQGLLVFGHPADNAAGGCAWLMRLTP